MVIIIIIIIIIITRREHNGRNRELAGVKTKTEKPGAKLCEYVGFF